MAKPETGRADEQTAQTDDDDEEEDPPNAEKLEFDGSDRQKQVSERMFDYCISELREAVELMRATGGTPAVDANAIVYMSDTVVTSSVKERLKAAVAPLESVPEADKDWHPGSDGKVLNLVHPSLYPLIYGRSKILSEGTVPLRTCHKHSGEGEVSDAEVPLYYSGNFQWLPFEVKLANDGKVKITSYINNLHPVVHEALYSVI